jgi:hypothetical protein
VRGFSCQLSPESIFSSISKEDLEVRPFKKKWGKKSLLQRFKGVRLQKD